VNPSAIRRQAFDRWKEAKDASRKWRKEAREDYDFYAGRQWDSADEAFLREQRRPVITFNRTAPFIDAIVGTELNNRQETSYLPRTINPDDLDAAAAELFTEGAKWIRQSCDADDNETEAYQDALICGMGWTETRIAYDEDPDGKTLIERVSPLEMYWTAGACRPNLADASDFWRIRHLPTAEVKQRWPNIKLKWDDIESWADLDLTEEPHDSTPPRYDNDSGNGSELRRGMVRVVQYQWAERESYLRTVDPESGDDRELNPDMLDEFRGRAGADHPITRQSRKRWYQCIIIGAAFAEPPAELYPGQGGESCPIGTFRPITGKRDENERAWHGVVRAAKDPQRWANKFYSQIQDIINSNAKGGVMIETDAVENIREFENKWTQPDGIAWMAPGAVEKGKVLPKPSTGYPTGLDKLMNMAIEAIPMTTGVSYELLGITGTNQPNVLEKTRIGRSMTVLAKFASALRGYRKQQGRVLLHLMRHFVPPEVLERATGKPNAAALMSPDVARFDVVVDQSPTSPTLKEDIWQSFMQIAPMLKDGSIPFPMMTILEYAPFPDSFIQKMKAEMQQQQQAAEPQKQMQMQQQAADVMKTQADAKKSVDTGDAAVMGAKTNLLEAVHEVMSPPEPKAPPMGRGGPPK
jgi:hypothetical protein